MIIVRYFWKWLKNLQILLCLLSQQPISLEDCGSTILLQFIDGETDPGGDGGTSPGIRWLITWQGPTRTLTQALRSQSLLFPHRLYASFSWKNKRPKVQWVFPSGSKNPSHKGHFRFPGLSECCQAPTTGLCALSSSPAGWSADAGYSLGLQDTLWWDINWVHVYSVFPVDFLIHAVWIKTPRSWWVCYWPGFLTSLINRNWSEARQEI